VTAVPRKKRQLTSQSGLGKQQFSRNTVRVGSAIVTGHEVGRPVSTLAYNELCKKDISTRLNSSNNFHNSPSSICCSPQSEVDSGNQFKVHFKQKTEHLLTEGS